MKTLVKTFAVLLIVLMSVSLTACELISSATDHQSVTSQLPLEESTQEVSDYNTETEQSGVETDPTEEITSAVEEEKTTEQITEEATSGTEEENTAESVIEETTGHIHSWRDALVLTEATCTSNGEVKKSCSCGEYVTETTEKLPHIEEILSAKDATCTEEGKSEGKTCSACGEILVAQTVIPAKGHSFDNRVTVTEATCSSNGSYNLVCTCGEFITETTEKLPHTEEILSAKDATCTEEGKSEGKTCSACGEILVAQTVIPAEGHSFDNRVTVTEATCTSVGKIKLNCACGEYRTENTKKLPHKEEIIPGKNATCVANGLTEGKKCSVCKTVILKQNTISAKGHRTSVVNKKSATCTESGYTGDTYCSVCKSTVAKGKSIAALGHKEIEVKGKKATCTNSGLTIGKKCSVCGTVTVKGSEIPATGHRNTVVVNERAPTCKRAGYTGDTACNDCNTWISYGSEIPCIPHTEVWVEGVPAKCTLDGVTSYSYCSVCKLKITARKVIPATGHQNTRFVNYKDASVLNWGYTGDIYCDDCDTVVEKGEVIPRLPGSIFVESVNLYHWDQESLYRDIEEGIVYYSNLAREAAGLEPLVWVEEGYCFAKIRADEVVETFSHDRPDGRSFYTAYQDYGIQSMGCGENILRTTRPMGNVPSGFESIAEYFVDLWMNSPGHRANILRENYKYICVAIGYENGKITAVQNFFAD